jgi:hypothetical protein
MAQLNPAYPTGEHEVAAEAVVRFFSQVPETEAVLLVNSCARGKASKDSCLDINVLVKPDAMAARGKELNAAWEAFYAGDPVFKELAAAGKYAEVHLDVVDGVFVPVERDWQGGPDTFEIELGNALSYSVPLWQRSPENEAGDPQEARGTYYEQLKAKWLPYYDEELRKKRLAMARHFCINNLDHIPLYVARGLFFQSFDRLYNAHREFLQALFIAKRTYPIAYDKWIREQIVEILDLPDLYRQLTHLFEISRFESNELVRKAEEVRRMLDEYAPAQD